MRNTITNSVESNVLLENTCKLVFTSACGLGILTNTVHARQSDDDNGAVNILFTIKNTRDRDGDKVAQVSFHRAHSNIVQPKLAPCGLDRAYLKRGESNRVKVDAPAESQRHWDTEKKQYVVELGQYEFLVGVALEKNRLKLPITTTAEQG